MSTANINIGIIGSGIVARVLGTAFLLEGYQVMVGSRTPDKAELVKWQGNKLEAKLGTFAEATAFGNIIVLAIKGTAIMEAIQQAGKENFAGKTIIDATNPIADAPPVNGVLPYFTGPGDSLMEQVQRLLPDAHLVKAFNSVGNAQFYKPAYAQGKPTMFICGNNENAKQTVTNILYAFGWETADMGTAEAARAIEPLAMLWCILGFTKNQWGHAFKLLIP